MSFDVNGKTALVTGANRGIGKTIVERLLAAGIGKVYAAAREVDSVANMELDSGGRVVAVQLDLQKGDTIAAAARIAHDVQLVINNAGVLKSANPLDAHVLDALEYEIDVNVKGLIRMAQAFVPVLKSRGGAFVQLNSVASLRSFSDFSSYCASKAAAYSITQALRDMLARHDVQVMSVHPGPIATDMARDAGLVESAEPPEVVALAIIEGLKDGSFHVFPDALAQSFWRGYTDFARSFVESAGS